MPIFKLKKENHTIENAVLVPASKTSLELEKHLEGWLENSPWAIAQEPLLIIGRQTTATTDEYGTINLLNKLYGRASEGLRRTIQPKFSPKKTFARSFSINILTSTKAQLGARLYLTA